MPMKMAFAMNWILVWVHSMPAVCATVLAIFTPVDAMRFQKVIAIATEMFWMNAEFAVEKAFPKVTAIATATKLMPLANVAEHAILMPITMVFAMILTRA